VLLERVGGVLRILGRRIGRVEKRASQRFRGRLYPLLGGRLRFGEGSLDVRVGTVGKCALAGIDGLDVALRAHQVEAALGKRGDLPAIAARCSAGDRRRRFGRAAVAAAASNRQPDGHDGRDRRAPWRSGLGLELELKLGAGSGVILRLEVHGGPSLE
jgi:hypothetical protein